MIKLKFIRNKAILKITNTTHKNVTFRWTEMIAVVDLRSLGFYKIKQEVLQEHSARHYHFELADDVCDQYNRFDKPNKEKGRKFQRKIPLVRGHR